MKSTACALLALLLTGCAVTREEAQAMNSDTLCHRYYAPFSASEESREAIGYEIAKRQLDCSAEQARYQTPPVRCTSIIQGNLIQTVCY